MTKKKWKLILGVVTLGFLLYTWISGRQGQPLAGKVISVHDGDTITILKGIQSYKIRLFAVDCPELGQSFGRNARQFTSDLVFGKQVTVYYTGKDRYQRYLGTVTTADGKNLNRELVKAGLAWHYKAYSDDPILAGLEVKARMAKKGLWADPQATAPWNWRKARRE